MKSIFLSKTSEGAAWAVNLARRLKEKDVLIDVVLPDLEGSFADDWRVIADKIFLINLNIRGVQTFACRRKANGLKKAIIESRANIVHSCFMDTTLIARLALHGLPNTRLVFHVPGPLHLENPLTRIIDIKTARKNDYWISSSKYTYDIYRKHGVHEEKLFHSYYGLNTQEVTQYLAEDTKASDGLLERYAIPRNALKIINANMFYPPKKWLGQMIGVKNHEGLIRSIRLLMNERNDIVLLIVGKQWGDGIEYEEYLKREAKRLCGDNIIFTGYLNQDELFKLYRAADLVVHVPISENCGGVIEPALLEKPIIASRIGGLPEVIEDGVTGWLTDDINPENIARKISDVIRQQESWRSIGIKARERVESLFDIEKTSEEVYRIYSAIVGP